MHRQVLFGSSRAGRSWLTSLLLCSGGPVLAQAPVLEEVVVTAQKRAQSLQDVPISVQALDGARINDAGIQKLEDLSAYTPNFKMTETAVGNAVFIRGIGSGINQGFEQSVGMFIDGIYAGRSQQFRAPFLDLERVEVLKGPQGTLFGKNTIAGAINITTAKPGDEFEGRASALGDADHGEREASLVLSAPLTERLGGRLAAQYREFDGYLDNIVTGREEPAREERVVRGTLRWLATDSLEITATFETGYFDVGGRAIQVSDVTGEFVLRNGASLGTLESQVGDIEDGRVDSKKTSDNFPGNDESTNTDSSVAIVTVNWDIGGFNLTSISGRSTYRFDEVTDADFTSLHFLNVEFHQKFEQLSQELRLTSPAGERLDYIAGLYWQQQNLDNDRFLDADFEGIGIALPPPLPLMAPVPLLPVTTFRVFEQDAETVAAFAQATWTILERLRLTGGLRWARETKSAEQALVISDLFARDGSPATNPTAEATAEATFGARPHRYDESRRSTDVTPSVTLQYDVADDIMVYLRGARGFKSGGFNEEETSGEIRRFEFEDEEAQTLELGAKMRLLGGAAELNINAFDTNYENRQVSAFDGDSFVVGNAAASTTRGMELDGRLALSERLMFTLSLAYLDSTFDDFSSAGCTADQTLAARRGGDGDCVQNLSGGTTEFAPEWTASASIGYRRPLGDALLLRALLDANYSDDYFYAQDLDPAEFQEAYTKFNARLALAAQDERWEIALVGKNLTDETVTSHGNDIPLYLGAHFAFTERPRSVALQGTLRF